MLVDLSLSELTGQLIVGGFDGTSLPQVFADALNAGERGGAILFKRNLPSLQAAAALCRELIDTASPQLPPFVGIDEEGGRVRRLPTGPFSLPAMRALAAHADNTLAERAGRALGELLGALGFNTDFAPVLDVDSNPDNPVIGDRSFSRDPDQVTRLGLGFARGLELAGVMPCGKHFPGHGDTSLDSHLDLPRVEHGRRRLEEVELVPFRAAAAAAMPALMSAHVVFTALDPLVPATLSRPICTGLLRADLHFQGLLFSDDLEMRALADRLPIEQSAVRAIEAGCDALLICHDLELQHRAHEALLSRARQHKPFQDRCVQAVVRSLEARRRFPPRPAAQLPESALTELATIATQIRG